MDKTGQLCVAVEQRFEHSSSSNSRHEGLSTPALAFGVRVHEHKLRPVLHTDGHKGTRFNHRKSIDDTADIDEPSLMASTGGNMLPVEEHGKVRDATEDSPHTATTSLFVAKRDASTNSSERSCSHLEHTKQARFPLSSPIHSL